MVYFQSLSRDELTQKLLPLSTVKSKSGSKKASAQSIEEKRHKKARYRAKQIFNWVYQRKILDWDLMSDLPLDLREWLKENLPIFRLKQKHLQKSVDLTQKFLWELEDSKTIESVLIPSEPGEPNPKRVTICISSQVGCAMGCKFCLTGVQGLDRNLKAHEIVTQVLELSQQATISNIVFMGMGEPLHNVENVIQACLILLDQEGMNFSRRKITVSTSGVVSAIERLGETTGVTLAVSLNAPTDEQREQIMPVNRKWNIETLIEACKKYPKNRFRKVTFEYVLIKDFNDRLEDASKLFGLLKDVPAKVNLIPFNEHPGSPYGRPTESSIHQFKDHLLKKGLTTTVRYSKGRDILAACGQLRSVKGTVRERGGGYVEASR